MEQNSHQPPHSHEPPTVDCDVAGELTARPLSSPVIELRGPIAEDEIPDRPFLAPHPPQRAHAGLSHAERTSNLRTVLGLVVLWTSLLIVFLAHHMSESTVRLETSAIDSRGLASDYALLRALEPRVDLLLPFSMSARGTSPRQGLLNIANYVGFDVPPRDLQKVSETPTTLDYNKQPLYQVIHSLIDNPKRGFALAGRRIMIFNQKVELNTGGKTPLQMNWAATLPLSQVEMTVMPHPAVDVYFSVKLDPALNQSASTNWQTVQVKVWKGPEWLTMARAELDESGTAQVSMSTHENISFSVERAAEEADKESDKESDKEPQRYKLQFYYQAFE